MIKDDRPNAISTNSSLKLSSKANVFSKSWIEEDLTVDLDTVDPIRRDRDVPLTTEEMSPRQKREWEEELK